MTKKKKLTSILWALGYLLVTVCVLTSGCIFFHNWYFQMIYVDGVSMQPTLNRQGKTEFGIVDSHSSAINNIDRFDIITTYYPIKYKSSTNSESDYSYFDESGKEIFTDYSDTEHDVQISSTASYKIKRVIALPGEAFKVSYDGVTVKTMGDDGLWGEETFYKFPFTHASNGDKTNSSFIVLDDNEYWVLGDNWASSLDSYSLNNMKVKKGNIQGVLVAIEGTCDIVKKNNKVQITNKKYYSSFKFF